MACQPRTEIRQQGNFPAEQMRAAGDLQPQPMILFGLGDGQRRIALRPDGQGAQRGDIPRRVRLQRDQAGIQRARTGQCLSRHQPLGIPRDQHALAAQGFNRHQRPGDFLPLARLRRCRGGREVP